MGILSVFLLLSAADDVASIKKLAGTKDEKQIDVLVKALSHKEKDVRQAAAETLETADDAKGKAIKPLGARLTDKKEDVEVRYAAAKALAKAQFKHDALEAYITCITSIQNTDRDLHKFGADVTELLNKFSGEDFGKGKQTPMLWEQWWADNKEKLRQEDARKRAGK
jgi:thioredoxin-like negative regulator of GroEL